MHDSFWTHATDVTEMNKIIRDQFIVLHENVDPDTKEPKCAPPFRPGRAAAAAARLTARARASRRYILTELDEALRARYSQEHVDELPDLPPYGELDLASVKGSHYFFS